ncbi:MAG TPA: GNAT family N-acetyltransferase [Candidatus Dormibacteraeota bacterium]|nr:GNAT family N-acetyltransferase [Candidatus Dormibacteraeota bacterium]
MSVRRAHPSDAAAIADLYCEGLGEGYASSEGIDTELRGVSDVAFFVATSPSGEVVGAADALRIPRASLLDCGVLGFRWVQEEILGLGAGCPRFGLLQNVVVGRDWRGRGLGAALLDARLGWLRQVDAGLAYSFAWHTPEGCPASGLLTRAGFRRVREVPDFYLADGLANGYVCPFCGVACRCAAVLYARSLP